MQRIRKITLENFQAHKLTVLDTDSDVVVFSGESSNGKTSIMRGLSWLMTNRPSGDGFVSTWAKEMNRKGDLVMKKGVRCAVTVELMGDDGNVHTISRVKDKDSNSYVVDGQTLSAVGTSVPKEVTDMLGMHDANVQSQDDLYFFLTLTPGQAAAELNRLVHLDTIDKAYAYAKSEKTSANSVYKEWNGIHASRKLEYDGLKHLEELDELRNELRSLVDTVTDLNDKAEAMADLIADIHEVRNLMENRIGVTEEEMQEMEKLMAEYQRKTGVVASIKENISKMVMLQEELASTVNPDIMDKDLERLNDLLCDYHAACDEYSPMNNMMHDWNRLNNDLERCAAIIADCENDLPETCPTCGQPLDKELL